MDSISGICPEAAFRLNSTDELNLYRRPPASKTTFFERPACLILAGYHIRQGMLHEADGTGIVFSALTSTPS